MRQLERKRIARRLLIIALGVKTEKQKATLKKAAKMIEQKPQVVLAERVLLPDMSPSGTRGVYVEMCEDHMRTAYRLLDRIDAKRALYRWPSGKMRMLSEESKPPRNAEFLGVFDLGATVHDLKAAIE